MAQTAAGLLDNVDDPKIANSQVWIKVSVFLIQTKVERDKKKTCGMGVGCGVWPPTKTVREFMNGKHSKNSLLSKQI